MRNIPLIILFVFPLILVAQPVLTYENCTPVAGLVFETVELDELSPLFPGDSGEHVVWDFSTVSFKNTQTALHVYKNPWNSIYFASHQEANLVKTYPYGDVFYVSTSDSLLSSGSHASNSYWYTSDKMLIIPFPFTYQSTATDTMIGWGDSGIDNCTNFHSSSFLADGYGTLILPGGTILSDVLRVRITAYQLLVVDVSNHTVESNITTYRWYKPGIKEVVLEYREWTSGWPNVYRTATVQSTASILGFQDELLQQASVYPNPITTSGTIRFSNPELHKDFILYTSDGTLVLEKKGLIEDELKLYRTDFESGLYFYQVSYENGLTGRGKIVFE